jgi:hypothetical protein
MGFSAVPLGHKFTAVLVAAAAGFGIHTWLERRAVQTAASAEVSFSMHAAQRLDAGFVHAGDPAVVFAQSVLSDQKIAVLSKQAFLSTSGMMSRVGEFRSRLELTQPSPEVLWVRFHDADPSKAVQTANAVADALVAWSPSPDAPAALTEPTSAAAAQPAAQQPALAKTASAPAKAAPAPISKPAAPANNEASATVSPLATALEQLQSQLSSTSRQIDDGGTAGHARPGYEGRVYAQSEQQHLLKAQVRDAQQKVSGLRSQYSSGANAQHLGTIQQALASILAGGSVGVSAGQLRRERDGLTRAIAVVQTQRAAIVKEAGADSSPASAPPTSSTSNAPSQPQTPAASGSASSAISESDLTKAGSPAPASQASAPAPSQPDSSSASAPIEDPSLANPFRMEKAAGIAAPIQWWPAAAAGAGCGLLYFLLMAMVSGRRDDESAYAEDTVSYGRFITSDAPVSFSPPVPPAEPAPVEPADRGQGRRASFTWDPGPGDSKEQVENGPLIESEKAAVLENGEAPAANGSGDLPVAREAFYQERPAEKVVEIDPWADLVQKALSETDIGRKFEKPGDRADDAPRDNNALRPDRLAG